MLQHVSVEATWKKIHLIFPKNTSYIYESRGFFFYKVLINIRGKYNKNSLDLIFLWWKRYFQLSNEWNLIFKVFWIMLFSKFRTTISNMFYLMWTVGVKSNVKNRAKFKIRKLLFKIVRCNFNKFINVIPDRVLSGSPEASREPVKSNIKNNSFIRDVTTFLKHWKLKLKAVLANIKHQRRAEYWITCFLIMNFARVLILNLGNKGNDQGMRSLCQRALLRLNWKFSLTYLHLINSEISM